MGRNGMGPNPASPDLPNNLRYNSMKYFDIRIYHSCILYHMTTVELTGQIINLSSTHPASNIRKINEYASFQDGRMYIQ